MEQKNNKVLSIIALATLIVAVLGATYAYFIAQSTGNNGAVPVNIQTKTIDSGSITVSDETIEFTSASQANFVQNNNDSTDNIAGVGEQVRGVNFDDATATVTFKANNAQASEIIVMYQN